MPSRTPKDPDAVKRAREQANKPKFNYAIGKQFHSPIWSVEILRYKPDGVLDSSRLLCSAPYGVVDVLVDYLSQSTSTLEKLFNLLSKE